MSKDKKRKRPSIDPTQPDLDTTKPTAHYTPLGPRTSTLSIALPASIIANAKSHDQKTYLAGTLARAFAVFCVDEVVIFDDRPPNTSTSTSAAARRGNDEEGYTALSDPAHFLIHLLSFLETPPHLRKTLFPMHANLRTAGTLPSLDMPHHLRREEWCEFREGVVTRCDKEGAWVDVGLGGEYLLPGLEGVQPKTRVTARLPEEEGVVEAEAVSPETPRVERGYYWGYVVRRAGELSEVFTECGFEGGYDVSFGTSERGRDIKEVEVREVPRYKHLLVVFGGVAGLETAARNDPALVERGIGGGNVGELFDFWVNLVPGQGSRTIRTEEAVWCGLMGLKEIVDARTSDA